MDLPESRVFVPESESEPARSLRDDVFLARQGSEHAEADVGVEGVQPEWEHEQSEWEGLEPETRGAEPESEEVEPEAEDAGDEDAGYEHAESEVEDLDWEDVGGEGEESASISGGRLEVVHLPALRQHTGTPPDLVLSWNAMGAPRTVDVVVHLHGYSPRGRAMRLPRDMVPVSGLDFSDPEGRVQGGRVVPTLLVLPRGHFFGGLSGRGYTFPALEKPGAIGGLVDDALARFGAHTNVTVGPGRLILTAHSGGGRSLMQALRHTDPDEVHAFDALYWDTAPLIAWAERRIARGDGAMRIIYRPGTTRRPEGTARNSQAVARAIGLALARANPVLRSRFRVEGTDMEHMAIPRTFGWRLLADPGADVPRILPQDGWSEATARDAATYAEDPYDSEDSDGWYPNESEVLMSPADVAELLEELQDVASAAEIGPESPKAPKGVPPSDPVPFAPAPRSAKSWPLQTAHQRGHEINYEAADGAIVGSRPSRGFHAHREGGRRHHNGVDLFANYDDAVVAVEKGTIVAFFRFCCAPNYTTYTVFVEHPDVVVNYGEVAPGSLRRAGLRIGSTVEAGQVLGYVGRNPAGSSMLHFETYLPGTRRNARWMVGTARPATLLNPTTYLLALPPPRPVGSKPPPAPGASAGTRDSGLFQRIEDALHTGRWSLALGLAIIGGERDVTRLTDLVFFAKHPEQRGRRIEPGQAALAASWRQIRDTLVVPALRLAATATRPSALREARTSDT